MSSSTPRRRTRFHKTGPIRAARGLLGDNADAPRQRIVGRLLMSDALHGLRHPDDDRRLRPGLLGSLAAVLITCVFVAIPAVILAQDSTTFVGRTVDSITGNDAASASSSSEPDPFLGFAEDPGFGDDFGFDVNEVPEFVGIVLYLFLALGAAALLASLIRVVSKIAAYVKGRRLTRTPPTPGERSPEDLAELEDDLYRSFAEALSFSSGIVTRSSSFGGHHGDHFGTGHHGDTFHH
ncbi:hypothetical protein GCM10027020_08290 [Nocardioides salsibiostraticola]